MRPSASVVLFANNVRVAANWRRDAALSAFVTIWPGRLSTCVLSGGPAFQFTSVVQGAARAVAFAGGAVALGRVSAATFFAKAAFMAGSCDARRSCTVATSSTSAAALAGLFEMTAALDGACGFDFAGGGAAFVFATDAAKVGAGTTGSEGRRNENAPGVYCCLPPNPIGVGTYGPPKFNGSGEVGAATAEFCEEAITPQLAATCSRDARHARCGLRKCLGKTAAEARRIGAGKCCNPYR